MRALPRFDFWTLVMVAVRIVLSFASTSLPSFSIWIEALK